MKMAEKQLHQFKVHDTNYDPPRPDNPDNPNPPGPTPPVDDDDKYKLKE